MDILNELGNCELFLDGIFDSLNNDLIDVSEYQLDHICYRVSTIEKYNYLRKELLNIGKLLSETIISGRNISTFKLNDPIIYKNREIYVIEIPSPKENHHYKDGFEHIEFVIDISFDDFIKKYSNLVFSTLATSKNINPDIKIQYDTGSVKFHHNSLEYVIENLE